MRTKQATCKRGHDTSKSENRYEDNGACILCAKERRYERRHTVNVYAYFDKEGIPLYVGRGSVDRFIAHKRLSKWWSNTTIRLSMSCNDEWHSMEMEGKWGGHYRPLYNTEGNRK